MPTESHADSLTKVLVGEDAAEDDRLAVLAARGDADAFGRIYDRYALRVARFLQTYAWTGADLEDLVHETFCRVMEALPAYDPVGFFRSWLFKIALNVARREKRRQRRVVRLEHGTPAYLGQESPHDRVEYEQVGTRLLRCLDESKRLVVILRIWLELPYDEIAALLTIPSGTARRRMHSALKQMRELLRSLELGKEMLHK
jgi:RNA polymerase sigma-70 factor (ECF subfamily)